MPHTSSKPSFRKVGELPGYPIDFRDAGTDPFVSEALMFEFGVIPTELLGWTRSGGTIDDLVAGVFKYDREYKPLPKGDAAFTKAVDQTYAAFKMPRRLQLLDLDEVDQFHIDHSKSAGLPWRGKKKREVRREAMQMAEVFQSMAYQGKGLRGAEPCQTFKRTQLSTVDKRKVRAVWGYSYPVTLLEGRFAAPMTQALKVNENPSFIGRTMEYELPNALNKLGYYRHSVGIDWSGFDSSVSPGLIRLAFDVLRQNFELSEKEGRLYDALVSYFINTRILTPSGDVYQKVGGIPSGSFFTQLIGSVVNYLVITYLQIREFGHAMPTTKVLGDDSVFGCEVAPNLGHWERIAQSVFGMSLGSAKSQVTTDPRQIEFLGHSQQHGALRRDGLRVLRLALYPEYPVLSVQHSITRLVGLMKDSGHAVGLLHRLAHYLVIRHGTTRGTEPDDRAAKYVFGYQVDPHVWQPLDQVVR